MYGENERQDFNQMNPEEHRAEEPVFTPNFVMRDPQPQAENQRAQTQAENQRAQTQAENQRAQSQAENQRAQTQAENQGAQPQAENRNAQPQYGRGNGYAGYEGNTGGYGEGQPGGGMSYPDQEQSRYRQSHRYQDSGGGNIPPERPGKGKKKRPMLRKAAGLTAAALLFGAVSGGTMVGINWAAGRVKPEEDVQVSLSETLPETESGQPQSPTVPVAVSMDVSSIVEKAMPSVVAITNTMLFESNAWFGMSQTYKMPSSGSGIILGQNEEELLIVTNNHVVQSSEELKVTFIDSTSVDAAIKGTDSDSDLAVIAVPLSSIPAETLSQIAVANLGDSDALKVGQGVVAIGNALGYGQSVTVGYISALDREVRTDDGTARKLLQTDAAINPGNSGGALLNMRGEVIGINVAKLAQTDIEGIGYAIPISQAQDIINELMNKKTRVEVEEARQGYLGIQGKAVDDFSSVAYGMPRGIFIYKIVEEGAASKSDLHEKDIITKFEGQAVKTMEDLKEMLTYYEGGSTVTLTVQSLQEGAYVERQVEITLDFKPEESAG